MPQHQVKESPARTVSEKARASEQSLDVVRHLNDLWDRHDFDGFDGILADDFAWHGGSFGEVESREAYRKMVDAFVTSFPDLRIEIHTMIAEGDLVMIRNTVTGTHGAEFMGVPATGKEVNWNEHVVYRVADGKVAETWYVADIFGLLQQIGAIPNS